MNVLIMADGLGIRWMHTKVQYKQLLDINGIPIIVRTINQIKNYTDNITVFAPEDFTEHLPTGTSLTSLGYRKYQPRKLLDGILRAKDFWGDETIILLGDVIFSNKAINYLFSIDLPCWILGRAFSNKITGKRAGELFAISFKNHDVEENIESILLDKYNPGKLWSYYHAYKPSLVETTDYTDDIDSPQAYEQFYECLCEAAKVDDEGVT